MTTQEPDSTNLKPAKGSLIADEQKTGPSSIVIALITALGGIVVALISGFFSYRSAVESTRATIMAEVTATQDALKASTSDQIISDDNTRKFYFSNGKLDGWEAYDSDGGWPNYRLSGEITLTSDDETIGGRQGPFLSLPLNLVSAQGDIAPEYNAIYFPLDADHTRITGIIANTYVESDRGYEDKLVHAGFFAQGNDVFGESKTVRIIPGQWNTVVWNMYAPLWWSDSSTEKEQKWQDFINLYDAEKEYMRPGFILNDTSLKRIGVEFRAGDGTDKFKGKAYIDSITIIYSP